MADGQRWAEPVAAAFSDLWAGAVSMAASVSDPSRLVTLRHVLAFALIAAATLLFRTAARAWFPADRDPLTCGLASAVIAVAALPVGRSVMPAGWIEPEGAPLWSMAALVLIFWLLHRWYRSPAGTIDRALAEDARALRHLGVSFEDRRTVLAGLGLLAGLLAVIVAPAAAAPDLADGICLVAVAALAAADGLLVALAAGALLALGAAMLPAQAPSAATAATAVVLCFALTLRQLLRNGHPSGGDDLARG
ncbi:MAG: hypothetical protein KDE35_17875 [Geminicoccaceae bacterium]|nr:hypothetical protein [Geminicoccaceae bacterium]